MDSLPGYRDGILNGLHSLHIRSFFIYLMLVNHAHMNYGYNISFVHYHGDSSGFASGSTRWNCLVRILIFKRHGLLRKSVVVSDPLHPQKSAGSRCRIGRSCFHRTRGKNFSSIISILVINECFCSNESCRVMARCEAPLYTNTSKYKTARANPRDSS